MQTTRMPWWAWVWPALAWLVLLATFAGVRGVGLAGTAGLALIATVFAAVYHAEVVAHRIGEPFGTIVLPIAVTIIEVALIISVVIAAPAEKADLARDTVFSAVMIVCNGVVGLRSPSRAGISSVRRERHFGRAGGAHDTHADLTEPGDERSRSSLQHVAACFRRDCVADALLQLHIRADGAASRIFFAAPSR